MKTKHTPGPWLVGSYPELPELPEPQKECWIGHDLYSADQMRTYAQAALNARAGGDDYVLVRKDVLHLATVTLGHAYHTVLNGELAEDAHTSYQALDAVLDAAGYKSPDAVDELAEANAAHDCALANLAFAEQHGKPRHVIDSMQFAVASTKGRLQAALASQAVGVKDGR